MTNPKLRFPVTAEVEQRRRGGRAAVARRDRSRLRRPPRRHRRVIVEPIQAEGGDNHFRPGFLQALQRKAHEHDALFIVDEVQTGVGITGRMWAHEHFGLTPDLLAFGKKAQVCGCMAGRARRGAAERLPASSRINSTWGGGLTDMVRAARFLEIIEEDGLLENARALGARLLEGLRALERELDACATRAASG